MKKGDFVWIFTFFIIVLLLALPTSRTAFIAFTSNMPFLGGFLKFFVLASMGELLGLRITTNEWSLPKGMIYRSLIWGSLGVVITLIFKIYGAGVAAAFSSGLLPGGCSTIFYAFSVSAIMNLTFAPTFMAFHRITDTIIDAKYEKPGEKIDFKDLISNIDWYSFISFVVGKTIPYFWIPAHTITFLLPTEYRVLSAAFLSIALGAILAFSKKRSVSL